MTQSPSESSIQQQVADALTAADESLAVAESLTGGRVGALLAEVPGAATVFDRGAVAYTTQAKREQLDVEADTLTEVGPVNGAIAEGMARQIRLQADTRWGVATTGIPGPPDGSHDKPVGTTYVGLAKRTGGEYKDTAVNVSGYEFDGSRAEIIEQAARQSLRNVYVAASEGLPKLQFR